MKTTSKSRKKGPARHLKGFWYDSRRLFCAATGKTVEDVKRASLNAETAKWFKNARINSLLSKWIDDHPIVPGEYKPMVSEKEQRQADKLAKENRKLDFEFAVAQKEYVKVDTVKGAWSQALEVIMDAMKAGMTREDYNAAIKRIKAKLKELDL